MENRYVKQYGGYTFHFTPQCTHDARFLAYLIINWAGDQTTIVEFSGALDLPSFGSRENAAEAAMAAGMHWMHTRNAHPCATQTPASRVAAAAIERRAEARAVSAKEKAARRRLVQCAQLPGITTLAA